MHLILQPVLLRRIKSDVEHLLPRKREYVLYAPLTKEQTELYNVISDRAQDTRAYLEGKVIERITGATNTPALSPASTSTSNLKVGDSDSDDDVQMATLIKKETPPETASPKRGRGRPPKSAPLIKKEALLETASPPKRGRGRPPTSKTPKNAFEQMMEPKVSANASGKRKAKEQLSSRSSKSTKSSRQSTPATSVRGRKIKKTTYAEADTKAEEALSDEDFENMLVNDFAEKGWEDESAGDAEEIQRAKTLELASMF